MKIKFSYTMFKGKNMKFKILVCLLLTLSYGQTPRGWIGIDSLLNKSKFKLKTTVTSTFGDSGFIVIDNDTLVKKASKTTMQTKLGIAEMISESLATVQSNTVVDAGNGITVVQDENTFTVSLYVAPSITSLTNTKQTNYAGQTVTGLTVNWTLAGASITSQTLTDCTPLVTDRTHVYTGLSLTTDKTYTLAITDGINNASSSTYVRFYIGKYYGVMASATPTESLVEAGTLSWVTQTSSNRALSSVAIVGGGNYVYYAYPASFGNVQLYVNGFANSWLRSTVSLTNAYGDVRNYYVYVSPNTIVGTIYLSAVAN